MGKPNRYEVAKAVGDLPSATTANVAEALGVDAGNSNLEKAFEKASQHGLIEQSAAAEGGDATFAISEKGKRKVAANS
ncbi:MAG: hypothetical protein QOG62_2595 [Thermoleophilaceae bacterium]|jgi:DNA-binding PadR family transcriptional regulator|nr:hypothetical protein [Thermoleophilaceae bacterium]